MVKPLGPREPTLVSVDKVPLKCAGTVLVEARVADSTGRSLLLQFTHYVINNLFSDCVLGVDSLEEVSARLDFDTKLMTFAGISSAVGAGPASLV